MLRFGSVAILSVVCVAAIAASFDLTRDINVTGVPIEARPDFLGVVGTRVVFTATEPSSGREVYASDGTSAGTIKLREFGAGQSGVSARAVGPAGDYLTFVVDSNSSGLSSTLWTTDGTAANTIAIRSFADRDVHWLGQLADRTALLVAEQSLWRTDGTSVGTVKLNSGVRPSAAQGSTVIIGTRLYYLAFNSNLVLELWETDGTVAGTRPVYRVPDGLNLRLDQIGSAGDRLLVATSGNESALHEVDALSGTLVKLAGGLDAVPSLAARSNAGNVAVFYAGLRVWRSDGTVGGTFPVTASGQWSEATHALRLIAVGTRVVFPYRPPSGNQQLWVTDGTVPGTSLLYEYMPGASTAVWPIAGDGAVAYVAVISSGLTSNAALIRTDGTSAGTRLLEFEDPVESFAPEGAKPTDAFILGSRVVVTVLETVRVNNIVDSAPRLYVTDGSTELVRIFTGDRGGAHAASPVLAGNTLFYSASRAGSGLELWATDGTTAGTRLPREIAPQFANAGSSPSDFARLGNFLLFSADDDANGRELWRTDGTMTGTTLITDINPGSASSTPQQLIPANGLVYFRARSTPGEGGAPWMVWRSDGTASGTFPLFSDRLASDLSIPMCPRWGDALGNRFAFPLYDTLLSKWFVYATDGTVAGTHAVAEFPEEVDESARPCNVTSIGDRLVFSFAEGQDIEPWTTDGTPAGTYRLANAWAGGASVTPDTVFARIGNSAVFAARTPTATGEVSERLWRTDGTTAGTYPLVEERTGQAPMALNPPVRFGTRVLFSGASVMDSIGTTGPGGLFITDGTPAGTQLLRASLDLHGDVPIAAGGGRAYFSARDESSNAIWVTDGTAAGTRVVTEVLVGGGTGDPGFVADGPVLYFVNLTADGARELWMSDGTKSGTRRLAPLAAANVGLENRVSITTLVPGRPFAVTVDPSYGTELFAVSNVRPVAVPDAVRVASGSTATIPVTLNDSDPDGAINRAGVHVTASPASGTAEPIDGGSVRYAPRSGFTGTDTFQYAVIDEWGGVSSSATVTVTVDAPPAPPPPPSPSPPPASSGGGGGSGGGGAIDLLWLLALTGTLLERSRRVLSDEWQATARGAADATRAAWTGDAAAGV
jgi:ELWxxDGT repeat protein